MSKRLTLYISLSVFIAWKLGQMVFSNGLAYHVIFFGSVLIIGFAWSLYMQFRPIRRAIRREKQIREQSLKELPSKRIIIEQHLNELLDKEKINIKYWQDEVKLPPIIKDDLKVLLIRRWGETASDQEFVGWAVKALEHNIDSPSLRLLAGLNLPMDRDDLNKYFEASLQELSIPLLTHDEMLIEYFHYVCKAIVDRLVRPDQGVNLIQQKVLDPLFYPDRLRAWTYMWEGHNPDGSFTDLKGVLRDELIIEYARKELETIKV